jgi:hypothetical protein
VPLKLRRCILFVDVCCSWRPSYLETGLSTVEFRPYGARGRCERLS